jgi:flagellar motor protein MotB
MGDERANKLQIAVFNAIKNNTINTKNDHIYSIHKFDGEGNIVHLITSKMIDEIEKALLPTKGLTGFGYSTAIKDALNQAIDTLAKDKESESKLIILLTDGYTNTDEIQLTLTDVIRKSIDNNISIAPVGFGSNVDDNYLRQIAYFAGGNMYKIYHENEFDQFFKNVFLDINLNYEVAFSPCKFGDELTIELKLKGLEKPLVGQTFFATPIKSGYSIDLNILFEPASSTIDKKMYGENLDQVFQLLKSKPDLSIIIEGHTDKVGRESYNKDLSLKRAEAVKKYFINLGVNANRIETKGYGWSIPAYPYINGKNENALNRRITLKLK